MNWPHVFPRANHADPDQLEMDRHIRQATRPPAAPSKKDIEQDARIRSLEREARELKIYVAGLIRLLAQKEAITPEEVEGLAELADRVKQDLPIQGRYQKPKIGDLIRPSEAA